MKKNNLLYFGKKIFIFFISVFILSTSVFYIARLAPGDPLVSYYGDRVQKMSVAERAKVEERLGLNESISTQYLRWIENAIQGDFGISYKYKMPVTEVIESRAVNTLILGGIGFILIFSGAMLLGVFCAWNEEKFLDKFICQVGTITSTIPEFWLSLLLILFFAVELKILPSSGAYSIEGGGDFFDRFIHLILPMSVVVINHLWYYAYMIRNKIIEEVRQDYVLLAKSKGLSNKKIIFVHCLRNVIPTYLSIMAISVPHILGGTYIIETVFSYPGIGTLSYESARFQDYNLLMILCILSGIIVITANIIAQAVNEKIDPRIKSDVVIENSELNEL